MENYKEFMDSIKGKKIYYLLDKDGVAWFPFRHMMIKILYMDREPYFYRDSDLSKYLKIICWGNPIYKKPKKETWFINYSGMCYFLKGVRVTKSKNELLENSRERWLQNTREYFGIETDCNLVEKYKNQRYDPSSYTGYPRICLDRDPEVFSYRKWKKCQICHNYLPYNLKYFQTYKSKKCLMCQNKQYKIYFENDSYFFRKKDTTTPNYFVKSKYLPIIKDVVAGKEHFKFKKEWIVQEILDIIDEMIEDKTILSQIYNEEILFHILGIGKSRFSPSQMKIIKKKFEMPTIYPREIINILRKAKVRELSLNIFNSKLRREIIYPFTMDNKLCFILKKEKEMQDVKIIPYNSNRVVMIGTLLAIIERADKNDS